MPSAPQFCGVSPLLMYPNRATSVLMPASLPARMSRAASPTYRHCAGSLPATGAAWYRPRGGVAPGQGAGVEHGFGVGLAVGGGVAAHDARRRRLRIELLYQGVGEKGGLVGHYAPVAAAFLQRAQQFRDARKQTGITAEIPGIDLEKALPQSVEFRVLRPEPEAEPDQGAGPVRDHRPDGLVRQRAGALPGGARGQGGGGGGGGGGRWGGGGL